MSDHDSTDETIDLRAVLLDLGAAPDEVDQATQDGTLPLLALEKIVSLEEPRFDIGEVAALAGLDRDRIRAYWRALGFPDPRPGQKLFTDSDVEMLSAVGSYIAEGTLEPELALQMSRVVGSAMDRIATAQVDALEHPDGQIGEAAATLPASARSTADLLSLMPKIMEYVWRRQLATAARRRMMRAAGEGQGVLVGFADLVGFTARVQQLDEHELAEVVGRFETLAYDTVSTHGGRVVKMIGDEVMFLHDDINEGAWLALEMADRFRRDPDLSDVRVGLACGPMLERDGDVYGPVVNLANRIVSVAYPGSVVVSEEVHDALVEDQQFVFRSLRSHYLKDIGRVTLWTLRRSADVSERPYRRARERMAARQFLRERWDALRRDADLLPGDLPAMLRQDLLDRRVGDEPIATTTGQFEVLTEAVLDADLEPEMQVELLADLEAERRLRQLEDEAQQRAAEADQEAERQLEEIEREARRKVEQAEREARVKIEQVLEEAEAKSRKVNEAATRKVARVAEEVEKKAERATKEAKVEAERKAKRRSRDRKRR